MGVIWDVQDFMLCACMQAAVVMEGSLQQLQEQVYELTADRDEVCC